MFIDLCNYFARCVRMVTNFCKIKILLKVFNDAAFYYLGQSGTHCVKSVRIWSYSGPYFPTVALNTERCGVLLCIQSEYGKYGPK